MHRSSAPVQTRCRGGWARPALENIGRPRSARVRRRSLTRTGARPGSAASDLAARGRVIFGANQNVARLAALRRTDDAVRFHDLDEPRRTRVSEFQTALEI